MGEEIEIEVLRPLGVEMNHFIITLAESKVVTQITIEDSDRIKITTSDVARVVEITEALDSPKVT